MTSTVHSSDCEVVLVGLDKASNLVVNVELSPRVFDGPAHVADPVKRAHSRDSSVKVTGVLEDSIFALKSLVSPLRSNGSSCVVDVGSAELPGLKVIRDEKKLTDISSIQVVRDRGTEKARRDRSVGILRNFHPGSVVVVRSTSLVGSLFSGDSGLSVGGTKLGVRVLSVANSINVVAVDLIS